MQSTQRTGEPGSVLEDGLLSGLIIFVVALLAALYEILINPQASMSMLLLVSCPILCIVGGIIGGYICHRHGWANPGQHTSTGALAGGISGFTVGILINVLVQIEGAKSLTLASNDGILVSFFGCVFLPTLFGTLIGSILGRITGAFLHTPGPELTAAEADSHKLLDSFSKRWIDRHIIGIAMIVALLIYVVFKLLVK